MPHLISRTPRMAESGRPSGLPADKNISSSVTRVIVKTPGKVHMQELEVGSPECIAQMLENPTIQQLLSNTDLLRQFFSEHPDMQQLMQQNPEVSHIFDNSEILWQTVELARNLAVIQEIMQIQQPAQNLENPLNSESHLGLETIPGGDNVQTLPMGQSYADFNDQMVNSSQDPFGGNLLSALLEGQVPEQIQSSSPSPPPPQEWQDQLPQSIQIVVRKGDPQRFVCSSQTTHPPAPTLPSAKMKDGPTKLPVFLVNLLPKTPTPLQPPTKKIHLKKRIIAKTDFSPPH
uniref:Ubiquilin like n=1 Tax=Equus asinus asinus TaxID=83772 RepID=A0A8C4KYW7_EQUAS